MTHDKQPWLAFLAIWRNAKAYEQAVLSITHLERCLQLPSAS